MILKSPSKNSFDQKLNISSFFQSNSEKDTGILLFADYFNVDELDKINQKFLKYFKILKSENITANVYHAIKLDGERRRQRLNSSANFLVRPLLNKLSFDISEGLKNKLKVYHAYVLQKRDDVEIDGINLD